LKDQLKGPSSVEGFVRTLRKGCRYIERKLTYCCASEMASGIGKSVSTDAG